MVKDPEALRTFVDTVISGDITTLSTQLQRDLTIAIRRELAYRRQKPISHICRLMSELPKSEWRGIKWTTLRDNYCRPPGTRRRRGQAYDAQDCGQVPPLAAHKASIHK